ncbi:ArsR/SmtB family transcription factor [Limosilactobacillus reuteri]|uniref:ArsR/SmtB family transcription factor n=1 Tax=Limosilactobacillus reuteri TaxID=1598 RepID=UPI001E649CB6|nr:metalloregulator ArsR/SmtB family transcription factor [Limosilactobacillus reuteri]MCC4381242.1 helix-turn-helix domain-containing protein [Limosilactobacillus reuteri]
MELNEKLFKALANKTRLAILHWLKDPEKEIHVVSCQTIQYELEHFGGICVGDIVQQAGLAQSTISSYLNMLEEVGLLISERHGKWTYYRRNEPAFRELSSLIKEEL